MVVGEGAAPSRHANLAFSRAYKTPLHGWCYPPGRGVVLWVRTSHSKDTAEFLSKNMRASIRLLAGLAIAIVVCFTAATLAAIALALAQIYFSGHGIATPHLTREYTLGSMRATGADILMVGVSVGSGLLAMVIWFLSTARGKRDSGAFSGAGLITAADSTPPSQKPRKSGEQPPSE